MIRSNRLLATARRLVSIKRLLALRPGQFERCASCRTPLPVSLPVRVSRTVISLGLSDYTGGEFPPSCRARIGQGVGSVGVGQRGVSGCPGVGMDSRAMVLSR